MTASVAFRLGALVMVTTRDGHERTRHVTEGDPMALVAACRARPDLYSRVRVAAVFQDEAIVTPPQRNAPAGDAVP